MPEVEMNTQQFNELKEWRHVSARAFLRNASELLDQLELSGEPLVITRHNRRAAVITRIADADLRERIKRPKPARTETSPEEIALPDIELEVVQRRVLLLVAGSLPRGWIVDGLGIASARQGWTAVNQLDIAGLVGPRGGRFFPTKVGMALALKLAAEEAAA
jgi:antitoxin (DNA-binding transcriptional repressor) of toxin-antitoxin stability system